MPYADDLSNQMSDIIGSDPNNNNVGYVASQVYPDLSSSSDDSEGLLSTLGASSAKAQRKENAIVKSETQSPLGGSYGNPLTWTSHITNMANFFKGAGSGTEYTGGITKPSKKQPIQAEDPNVFYSRWYMKMRQMAEAQEVANMGDVKVKTR